MAYGMPTCRNCTYHRMIISREKQHFYSSFSLYPTPFSRPHPAHTLTSLLLTPPSAHRFFFNNPSLLTHYSSSPEIPQIAFVTPKKQQPPKERKTGWHGNRFCLTFLSMQVVPHNSNVADDTERKGANGTLTPTIEVQQKSKDDLNL